MTRAGRKIHKTPTTACENNTILVNKIKNNATLINADERHSAMPATAKNPQRHKRGIDDDINVLNIRMNTYSSKQYSAERDKTT